VSGAEGAQKPQTDAPAELTAEERAIYEWQMWVPDFGEQGQKILKQATVLVSRCGGIGGTAAYYLAAAGVGKLVLAHGGNLRPSDLQRQILMTYDWLGKPRVECAARRLKQLTPNIRIDMVPENINDANAQGLVAKADAVVDCAPLFHERYLMNREAVRQNKPLVECAMYELESQITTILPGKTPCLACLYPSNPPTWKREFPVFGAVAGMAGAIGAMEVIKVLTGVGEPLTGRMLLTNLRDMTFRTVKITRNEQCAVCGNNRV
jgi:molybdopterin/thiamine biosynthesis adenylyltransferase